MRARPYAHTMPRTIPIAASLMLCPTTWRAMARAGAPSAIRTAISPERWLTA